MNSGTAWTLAAGGVPRNGGTRPALAGGAVGGERYVVVLDASNVLHDAYAVRSQVSIRKVK